MDVIKNFSDAQKKIYNDWKNRDKSNSEQEYRENMDSLFAMLRAQKGGQYGTDSRRDRT